ncbi:hypothetical protein [Chitinibacter sp. S2-10]|uniref:hypothetical protein n=1 Tax=Chitinibacter sp. S2-10 TaxID=3373597 RepID=UPI00397727F4
MFKTIPLPYRILIVVLLALAVFGAGLRTGWVLSANSKDAGQLKVQNKATKVQQARVASAAVADQITASQVQQIQIRYKTITKEVIKYAEVHPAPAASQPVVACNTLDHDWVRIHDHAADPDSEPVSEPDGDAGGAGKSEVLGVVARNYETCQLWRQSLIGWQRWWMSQQ